MKELEDYIHRHRKKGFSHDQISVFLNRHGWHHSHIKSAMLNVKKAETQRFIAGAIWYMLLIFVVSIGIVQLGKITGGATIQDVYCVADQSGLGQFQMLSSQKTCCSMARGNGCYPLDRPELLKDASGRAFYKADYTCVGKLGLMMINEAGLVRCN